MPFIFWIILILILGIVWILFRTRTRSFPSLVKSPKIAVFLFRLVFSNKLKTKKRTGIPNIYVSTRGKSVRVGRWFSKINGYIAAEFSLGFFVDSLLRSGGKGVSDVLTSLLDNESAQNKYASRESMLKYIFGAAFPKGSW